MNYEESVRALLALGRELAAPQQARVQKFGLENIRILSAELGDPHRAAPCVHVAGTNGKGSTAAMLESVLRSSGLKTGLYTSPHLERINERIRINGEELRDAEFAAAWTQVQSAIESLMASGKLGAHPTFFECVTATAFVAFQARRIDFAVYEVGLGGRLDSTNIVEPEVAVLTPIDFDHENFLGHSIEEIAREKAGIIKADAWVASSSQRAEAASILRERAQAMTARLVEVPEAWKAGEITSSGDGLYRSVASPVDGGPELALAPGLRGRFQVHNALTTATAAKLLAERGFPITNASISAGIGAARWPGRLEKLSERPAVYLDGAHNPAAARELRRFCDENFDGRRIILVYGAMRDKAVDEIAGLLFPVAERVILTQAHQTRAISAQLLAEATADLARNPAVVPDPMEAFEQALAQASPEDVIIATGSLYLVGDLRRYWHAHHPART